MVVVVAFLMLVQGALDLVNQQVERFHDHRPIACQVAHPTLADLEADLNPNYDGSVRDELVRGPRQVSVVENSPDGWVLTPTTKGEYVQHVLQDLAVCRSRKSDGSVDNAKYRQNVVLVDDLFHQYVDEQIRGDSVAPTTVQLFLSLTTPSPDAPPSDPSPTTWNPKTNTPGKARSGK